MRPRTVKVGNPNILWICTDQQRWDTLGATGNPFVSTPNIDRLATEGTLFTHAYCQSPVCTPSRASFLTGRYPRTVRCRQNGQPIPADEILVTRILADAGYVNGLSGKLHLNPCQPEVCKGTERRIADGYDEFHWSHHPQPDWPTDEYNHWLHAQGEQYHVQPYNGSAYVEAGMPDHLHHTTWCASKAVDFIEAQADYDTPWLFSVNIYDPHHPFHVATDYLDRYMQFLDDIPLPPIADGENERMPYFHHHPIECQYRFAAMSPRDHRLVRAAYWSLIDLIDVNVGRMLAALDRTGQRENTIVIFMSDHGEILGDHGIYLKGPYFYEPAIRVPLIVSGPAAQPQVIDPPVQLLDLPQTLLDAAGLEELQGMQGQSLWPAISGRENLEAEVVYCEYYKALKCHEDPGAWATMVRDEHAKLVRYHNINQGELYDLDNDPGETSNLWQVHECRELKLRMLTLLCDQMAWTIDPLPVREAWW